MPEFIADLADLPTAASGAWTRLPGSSRGDVHRVRVQATRAEDVGGVLGLPATRVLAVLAVREARPATPDDPTAQPASSLAWRRRAFNLRLFSQELAVLLQAGVPLLEALQTLREKDDGAGSGRATLDTVADALRDGLPVSAALARAPWAFDGLFIALVAASEGSGQLSTTLRDHAAYLAWSEALRRQLQAALVYPLMLLAAGGAVILFLLLFVLPRFAGVFDGLGRPLPWASQALIDLGVLAAAHPQLSLGLAALLPAAALAVIRWPAARAAAARAAWRSPGLGPHLRLLALARLYRGLGLALAAGVPAPAALALLDGVLAAPLRPALRQVRAGVEAGRRLSQAMQDARLATPVAWRMLRVGESTGELPQMLAQAAAGPDEQSARLSELVTRLVNPVLMLVLGVVIGGIVVLMYLPIFTLMEQIQ